MFSTHFAAVTFFLFPEEVKHFTQPPHDSRRMFVKFSVMKLLMTINVRFTVELVHDVETLSLDELHVYTV